MLLNLRITTWPKSVEDAASAGHCCLADTMKPLFAAAEEEEKAVVKALVQVPEQPTETEITSRLNSYRRDTLQQGGMRPSKGFGIAAKWAKFLSKVAPAKTIDQYVMVLRVLLTGSFAENRELEWSRSFY